MAIRLLIPTTLALLFAVTPGTATAQPEPGPIAQGTQHTVSGILEKGPQCVLNSLQGSMVSVHEYWHVRNVSSGGLVPPSSVDSIGALTTHTLRLANGDELEQGRQLGQDTINDDNEFKITWYENILFLLQPRLPWRSDVYVVSPDTIDPSDPTGYENTTVYRILGLRVQNPESITLIDSESVPVIMFYNRETEKELGNIGVNCFPFSVFKFRPQKPSK